MTRSSYLVSRIPNRNNLTYNNLTQPGYPDLSFLYPNPGQAPCTPFLLGIIWELTVRGTNSHFLVLGRQLSVHQLSVHQLSGNDLTSCRKSKATINI